MNYLTSVKKEAKKIVFPDIKDVRKNALIVIGVCTFAALLFWGVSEIILKGLEVIF